MEAAIKHAAMYVIWGAPVWAWLVGGAILGAQEAVARSPKLKANTYVQMVGNLAARLKPTILGKFPVLGQAIWALEKLKTPAPPTMADQAEQKAANS